MREGPAPAGPSPLSHFAVERGDECLDVLDEVGNEVDVPGVVFEVVGYDVKLHARDATPDS